MQVSELEREVFFEDEEEIDKPPAESTDAEYSFVPNACNITLT